MAKMANADRPERDNGDETTRESTANRRAPLGTILAPLVSVLGVVIVVISAAIVALPSLNSMTSEAALAAHPPVTNELDSIKAVRPDASELPAPIIELVSTSALDSQIAPPLDSPIHAIRRDCPLRVPLSDGRTLWIFCDTSQFEGNGNLDSFTNTTAAIAEADDPTTMHEPLDAANKPFRFITPTDSYQPCWWGQKRFVWPGAAVAIPTRDGLDHILIYYQSICAESGHGLADDLFHDMGVAEFVYDAKHPPAATDPLRATVINEQIFEAPADHIPFGQAAVLQGDHIYAYRCPNQPLGCFAARVRSDRATVRSAYEYWDGAIWSSDVRRAQALTMPRQRYANKPSVTYLARSRMFVMADAAGLDSGRFTLRAARSAQGPWSDPIEYNPPGCLHPFPHHCFGVEVHQEFSDAGGLTLTYYNATVGLAESPVRGVRVAIRFRPPPITPA